MEWEEWKKKGHVNMMKKPIYGSVSEGPNSMSNRLAYKGCNTRNARTDKQYDMISQKSSHI